MSQWIKILIAAAAAGLLGGALLGPFWAKRRMRKKIIFSRMLVFAVFAAAIAYKLFACQAEQNFMPFASWLRISELGYKAIWRDLAVNTLPFVAAGIALPFGFKWADSNWKALLVGALSGAGLCALRFALQGVVDIDEGICAALGMLCGFALVTVMVWIAPKAKAFRGLELRKITHIAGVFILLFAYLGCLSALFIDNGPSMVELSLFSPDQQLPQQLTLSVSLSDEEPKVPVYETINAKPLEDAQRIARQLGLKGQATVVSEREGTVYRAQVADGTKTLTCSLTGDWNYYDETVDKSQRGQPLSQEEALQAARNFLENSGVLGLFSLQQAEVTSITQPDSAGNPQEVQKAVYFTAGIDQKVIRGSCEIMVVVGNGGAIASVDKYNAYFEEGRAYRIISSREAYSRIRDSRSGHTLFAAAQSAEIYSAELGYWLEEVRGVLQPIWLFKGTAQLEDGQSKEFEIYVPAIK